jgi:S1-C subfamily serine protease
VIAARLLDVLLVLALLVFIGEGWRNGLLRSISGILGVVAGGILAFLAIPLVAAIVPDPLWRIVVVVALSLVLLFGGHAAGAAIGGRLRGRSRQRLGTVTRVVGALTNGVIAALVLALVAGGVGALGVPLFSQAISGSWVLRAIDAATPEPVDAALSRVRAAILEQGLPTIAEALGGVEDSPGVPDVAEDSDALDRAANSVVRIGGTAFSCGQNQTGTGFVVAQDRIVTNAHVVAGVDHPVVEAPNGQTLDGRLVYLDPVDDLAIVAVDGLQAPPLELAGPLATGTAAVVDGYPFGGPFARGAAEILAISSERIADIYGESRNLREVYTLAAVVQPGNSGGPLLTADGRVAGVVFARSATDAELGYAMTNAELAPVAQAAATLDAPVSAGACVRG